MAMKRMQKGRHSDRFFLPVLLPIVVAAIYGDLYFGFLYWRVTSFCYPPFTGTVATTHEGDLLTRK